MYIDIYICMYVFLDRYWNLFSLLFIYINICIYIYICMYLHKYIYIYICNYLDLFICLFILFSSLLTYCFYIYRYIAYTCALEICRNLRIYLLNISVSNFHYRMAGLVFQKRFLFEGGLWQTLGLELFFVGGPVWESLAEGSSITKPAKHSTASVFGIQHGL